MKQEIQVPGGIGETFHFELAMAGFDADKLEVVTSTRRGGNDLVEYEDQNIAGDDLVTLTNTISAHDPLTNISDEDLPGYVGDNMGNFVKAKASMFVKMNPGSFKDESTTLFYRCIVEMSDEGLADYVLGG